METRNWKVPFFTIWTGQAFSMLGSQLVQFALIWWLTETTGSAAVLATATAVAMLPTIFVGPFAGTLIDRLPRKWVLILADAFIALFTALLSLLFWLGVAQTWHIYVILFVRSLGGAFQSPAVMSTTPLMVPRDQLGRVAGMNSTLQGVLLFAAPPLSAMLLALIDVRGILPLDVLTAVLAILPLFFIAIPQPESAPTGKGVRVVLTDLREGFRYVWRWPGLRGLVGTFAFKGLANKPVIAFMPLLVTQHFGKGAQELSWLYAGWGIGLLVGVLILSAWGGFKRHMATHVLGAACMGIAMLATAAVPSEGYWLALAAFAFAALAQSMAGGGQRAVQQSVVAPEMQGRYFALNNSLRSILGPISLAITAPLVDRWGVRPLWFAIAAIGTLVTLVRRFVPSIYHLEDAAAVVAEGGAGVGSRE